MEHVQHGVLIVDDVPGLRRLIRITLEGNGKSFRVLGEAEDGARAIARARELQPDLVLLDLSMPGMDGLEALPHIRQAAPACTVVVLSGFDESRMGAPAIEAGAAAYVEKGAPPEDLRARLKEVMRR